MQNITKTDCILYWKCKLYFYSPKNEQFGLFTGFALFLIASSARVNIAVVNDTHEYPACWQTMSLNAVVHQSEQT